MFESFLMTLGIGLIVFSILAILWMINDENDEGEK